MTLDHPLIGSRYFYPRRDAPPEVFRVDTGAASLACVRARAPGGTGRGVVFFHGNGEVVADYVPWFSDALVALGLDVLLAEYRGYGGSSGTPALGAMLEDTAPLVHALGLPPERVIAFGRSVGSIYALECARRFPALGGLVLESAIADPLERVLLRVRPEEVGATEDSLRAAVADKLDHRAKIAGYRGPLLVLHARHDATVDATHAERLHAWSGSASRQLVILPRGDHNSVQVANRDAYWSAVKSFVDATATPAA